MWTSYTQSENLLSLTPVFLVTFLSVSHCVGLSFMTSFFCRDGLGRTCRVSDLAVCQDHVGCLRFWVGEGTPFRYGCPVSREPNPLLCRRMSQTTDLSFSQSRRPKFPQVGFPNNDTDTNVFITFSIKLSDPRTVGSLGTTLKDEDSQSGTDPFCPTSGCVGTHGPLHVSPCLYYHCFVSGTQPRFDLLVCY